MKRSLKYLGGLIALLVVAWVVFALIVRPSNDRDWATNQAVLPEVTFGSGTVSIRNIRNFTYRTTDDYTPRYEDATYNLAGLRRAWFIVEPFSGYAGAAHTFLSFEFTDGRFLAISVEIRKEKGESFSAWKGLLRRYELTYVIGDERDLVKLRSNYRHDDVFVYPAKATPEKLRSLFVSMLERSERLRRQPEFYNTLTNTCTTAIVSHVNAIAEGRIPFSWKMLFPAYSDELAADIGLIDDPLPLPELRQKYRINERALACADRKDFSRCIRVVR